MFMLNKISESESESESIGFVTSPILNLNIMRLIL